MTTTTFQLLVIPMILTFIGLYWRLFMDKSGGTTSNLFVTIPVLAVIGTVGIVFAIWA